MSGRFDRRSRSPSYDDYSKRSLLAKVEKSELTKIRVAIKRTNIIGNSTILDRTIDDLSKICALVHVRRGLPPRMPIFRGIKVNQDFTEDRKVYTSRQSRSRSRSRSRHYRSRSRSSSRRRQSRTRSRSKSYDYRGKKYHSRSRSRSPSRHKKNCIMYRSPEKSRKRRSITPLRPGEYRPGHPDLALRKNRIRSRSRSPRRDNMPSTSKRSRDGEFKDGPHQGNVERYQKGMHRHHPDMHGVDYGFYDGFAPIPIQPQFRGRFPMMDPTMFPRMYAPMPYPRMPMGPIMPPRMFYRPRWPNYNSEQTALKNETAVDKQPIVTEPEGDVKKDETLEVSSAVSSSKSDDDGGDGGEGGKS